MPFSEAERREIHARCTRFLGHRPPRPVAERLAEMAASEYAKQPQDFYGSGGFVAQLEAEVAELLGKEAAVFMPSGTMAQQIALRIWCDRAGKPIIAFHPTCHLEIHEQKTPTASFITSTACYSARSTVSSHCRIWRACRMTLPRS